MPIDERSCDFAIEIQIADVELLAGAAKRYGAAGVDAASECVARVIGDVESIIQRSNAEDGKNRTEQLLLGKSGVGIDAGENVGADIGAFFGERSGVNGKEQLCAIFKVDFADEVLQAFTGFVVNYRADLVLGSSAGPMVRLRTASMSR